MKTIEFARKKRRRMMRNVCLVTTQAFKKGSMDMETYTFTSAVRGYHVFQDMEATDQRKTCC